MQTQLRILILEDIQAELELLEYELDKAQLNYQSRCVYTRGDFLKALEVFNPNVILSDFNMPQFTGIEALSLVKKHYPFLPFIIITGTLTEERVVEFMKAGADDYIIKDHLNRIVPAIHSALDKKRIEKEKAQIEQTLRESEAQLRIILQSIDAGIFLIDPKTHMIVDANDAALSLIKAKREPVIGKIYHQFICLAEKDNCPVSDQYLTIDKSERQLLDINKESIPVLKIVTTIRIGDKELLLETIIDLTDRKRAEEAIRKSEEKYRDIVTWAPIGIYQSTPDGKFITVNNSLAGILGYDNVEELLKCNLDTDIYFNQEERQKLIKEYDRSGIGYVKDLDVLWKKRIALRSGYHSQPMR